ncbi:MAG: ATP-binding cassette domain-containing protein [Chthoniobacteraceae bacterium]
MLELKDVSLSIQNDGGEQFLLSQISVHLPHGHFAAIIGPSGCGKSTLLKVIAGIKEHGTGAIHWKGRDVVAEGDLDPHEIGYVPQFSIAYELLTVEECIESALRLRVAGLGGEELDARIDKVLTDVGLTEIGDRRVALLSGGQKRRLAMAMEMVSSPSLLLCDEVTSGLDPKSEDEIVHLMHDLSRSDERIVLSVTHSLQHVALYDSVIVLYQGHLVYHATPKLLAHYFGITNPADLYPRLAQRKASDWHRSWEKYRANYYEQSALPAIKAAAPAPAPSDEKAGKPELSEEEEVERLRKIVEEKEKIVTEKKADAPDEEPHKSATVVPGVFVQFGVLLARRWKLFFRDRGQVILQLALLFGFPCLVVIFAFDGLPQVKGLVADGGANLLERARQEAAALQQIAKTGTLVSGLIMFQVILLALMGSNNSAREVAGERNLFEKEKFAGLSPLAYVASKVTFLGALVFAQSLWMTIFVNMIVGFQGDFAMQALSLFLVNAAITSVCLGISSWMKSAEQSSLLSIYLVGFQLPLSGAVLALPKAIALVTQVFIASFWGWSGFIRSMESTRYYDAIKQIAQTEPANGTLCAAVLFAHVVIGLFFAYTGCKNSRWE